MKCAPPLADVLHCEVCPVWGLSEICPCSQVPRSRASMLRSLHMPPPSPPLPCPPQVSGHAYICPPPSPPSPVPLRFLDMPRPQRPEVQQRPHPMQPTKGPWLGLGPGAGACQQRGQTTMDLFTRSLHCPACDALMFASQPLCDTCQAQPQVRGVQVFLGLPVPLGPLLLPWYP